MLCLCRSCGIRGVVTRVSGVPLHRNGLGCGKGLPGQKHSWMRCCLTGDCACHGMLFSAPFTHTSSMLGLQSNVGGIVSRHGSYGFIALMLCTLNCMVMSHKPPLYDQLRPILFKCRSICMLCSREGIWLYQCLPALWEGLIWGAVQPTRGIPSHTPWKHSHCGICQEAEWRNSKYHWTFA